MTDAVCTNETRFFRDAEQLDFLERTLIPGWLARSARLPLSMGPQAAPNPGVQSTPASGAGASGVGRRLRLWSAGCSTGEEAYSIAMVLLAHIPAESGLTIEVLATDISGAALERARTSRWPAHRVQEIPEHHRQRFFEVDAATGDYQPSRELRNVVRFQRLNLCDWYYPVTGKFDVVFCRNVLIYFDTDTRAAVTRRLVERLGAEGHLFLGMAESLLAVRDGSLSPLGRSHVTGVQPLRAVGPAIYAHAPKPHAPRSVRRFPRAHRSM